MAIQSVHFAFTVPATTTQVYVSERLNYPFRIEGVILASSAPAPGEVLVRVLVAIDNDTANITDPNGDDIVSGDSQSVRFMPFTYPLDIDMQMVVPERGRWIKVWVQNLAAAARVVTVTLVVNDTPPGSPGEQDKADETA